jgi:hypothetical protein
MKHPLHLPASGQFSYCPTFAWSSRRKADHTFGRNHCPTTQVSWQIKHTTGHMRSNCGQRRKWYWGNFWNQDVVTRNRADFSVSHLLSASIYWVSCMCWAAGWDVVVNKGIFYFRGVYSSFRKTSHENTTSNYSIRQRVQSLRGSTEY